MRLPTRTFVALFQQSLRDYLPVVLVMTPWIVAEQHHLIGFGIGLITTGTEWHPQSSVVEFSMRGSLAEAWDPWALEPPQASIIKDRT